MLARLKHLFVATQKHSSSKKNVSAYPSVEVIIHHDEETGNCIINAQAIRTVGIGNLAEVIEHHVNHVYDTVSHIVRFKNGGLLRFAYANSGELIELYVERLNVKIASNGELQVSCLNSKD